MKKILDCLLGAIYLIYFGLTLLVFHLIQVIAFNVFGEKAHRTSVEWLNFCLAFGLYLTGARLTLRTLSALPQDRPIIFVANHQSTFDIAAIYWYLRKYKPRFVSKIELAHGVPSISYNLRKSGAALIDRKDGKQAISEIARLGRLIQEEKSSAIIFPEGTRTASGVMRPFVTGGVATLLKRAPDALIVPVAINGTGAFNPKGTFPLTSFSQLSWTVLPGIEPAGRKVDEILAEAQEEIRKTIRIPA